MFLSLCFALCIANYFKNIYSLLETEVRGPSMVSDWDWDWACPAWLLARPAVVPFRIGLPCSALSRSIWQIAGSTTTTTPLASSTRHLISSRPVDKLSIYHSSHRITHFVPGVYICRTDSRTGNGIEYLSKGSRWSVDTLGRCVVIGR